MKRGVSAETHLPQVVNEVPHFGGASSFVRHGRREPRGRSGENAGDRSPHALLRGKLGEPCPVREQLSRRLCGWKRAQTTAPVLSVDVRIRTVACKVTSRSLSVPGGEICCGAPARLSSAM